MFKINIRKTRGCCGLVQLQSNIVIQTLTRCGSVDVTWGLDDYTITHRTSRDGTGFESRSMHYTSSASAGSDRHINQIPEDHHPLDIIRPRVFLEVYYSRPWSGIYKCTLRQRKLSRINRFDLSKMFRTAKWLDLDLQDHHVSPVSRLRNLLYSPASNEFGMCRVQL